MAELERRQDRESWVSWAIEFVRRGLWPADVITVHGPHASSADRFWGEAEAWDESGTWSYTVAFQTPCATRLGPTRAPSLGRCTPRDTFPGSARIRDESRAAAVAARRAASDGNSMATRRRNLKVLRNQRPS